MKQISKLKSGQHITNPTAVSMGEIFLKDTLVDLNKKKEDGTRTNEK